MSVNVVDHFFQAEAWVFGREIGINPLGIVEIFLSVNRKPDVVPPLDEVGTVDPLAMVFLGMGIEMYRDMLMG